MGWRGMMLATQKAAGNIFKKTKKNKKERSEKRKIHICSC